MIIQDLSVLFNLVFIISSRFAYFVSVLFSIHAVYFRISLTLRSFAFVSVLIYFSLIF